MISAASKGRCAGGREIAVTCARKRGVNAVRWAKAVTTVLRCQRERPKRSSFPIRPHARARVIPVQPGAPSWPHCSLPHRLRAPGLTQRIQWQRELLPRVLTLAYPICLSSPWKFGKLVGFCSRTSNQFVGLRSRADTARQHKGESRACLSPISRFNRTNVPKPSQCFDQCVQNQSIRAQMTSHVQNPLTAQISGRRSPIESWSFSSEKSYSPCKLICCQVTTEPWRTAVRSS